MELEGLIVGLGNPGQEYTHTRHNFGFLVIDALVDYCEKYGRIQDLSSSRNPFNIWRCSLPKTQTWFLMQPLTFMNRSGLAVQRAVSYYKLTPKDVLAIHDELDLPLGRIRYKRGGGNAGHNGLKSIQEQLGTADFGRLRLGIGKPPGYDTSSFVLGKFSKKDLEELPFIINACVEGLVQFMHDKNDEEMQRQINSFRLS